MKNKLITGLTQTWSYSISHGCLILRRNKSNTEKTRIDMLFKNVEYICLPNTMENVIISEVDSSFMPKNLNIKLEYDTKCYKLKSDSSEGFIVCGYFGWDESSKSHNEPSNLLNFDGTSNIKTLS